MAAKYRRIDPRIWIDEKFQTLPRTERLIAFYVLTGQGNRIGIFQFSRGKAVEDLGYDDDEKLMAIDEFDRRLDKVIQTMGWERDEVRNVLYLPTWWRYNEPHNDKTVIGVLADLDDVPKSPLVKAFMSNTRHLPPDRVPVFEETVTRYFNRFGIDAESMAKSGTVTETVSGTGKPASPNGSHQNSRAPKFDPLRIEIPAALKGPLFSAAWSDWISYRRENRLPSREMTIREQLEFLVSLGVDGAIAAIRKSIRGGWKGLFDSGGDRPAKGTAPQSVDKLREESRKKRETKGGSA